MELINTIAEVLYTADTQPTDWDHALPEDRSYYTKVADVVVDTVTTYLQSLPLPTDAVVQYIEASSDIARLRRE